MNNQVLLVGRLTSAPKINEVKKYTKITIATPRNFKNADGIYETDFIPCILFGQIANATIEYCRKGDVIGIRGRIQINNGKIEIIVEKVSFLSSARKDGEEV